MEKNYKKFNQELKQIIKATQHYFFNAFWIEKLLQKPLRRELIGPALEIPTELRPDCYYDSFEYGKGKGKLGKIYLISSGMQMYHPSCDIYDADAPEKLLCKGHLFHESDCDISDILTVMQTLLDPDKQNTELQTAIEQCISYEQDAYALPRLLKSYGISYVDLTKVGYRYIGFRGIHADAKYITINDNDEILVYLESNHIFNAEQPFNATKAHYDISSYIKEAINRSRYNS